MSYRISAGGMDKILCELECDYKIYAPKRFPKRGGDHLIKYGEIHSASEIVLDRKSSYSPKEVFYPIIQTLFHFSTNSCTESELDDEHKIIIFARACDVNGIMRLDTIFLENGNNQDYYYRRMRDRVKLFLIECTESWDTCFCVSMGSNVAEDYSVALRPDGDEWLVHVKDEGLRPHFATATPAVFQPEPVRENLKKVQIPEISDKELLAQVAQLDLWAQFDENCIGCGTCNAVCITCSCFDTVDITYDESGSFGERRRVWSSCMLDDFTSMAGGHAVRHTAGDKMRFKTLHKIYDFKLRFGKENMCVGCGRCDTQCSGGISFSDTINALYAEVHRLKEEKAHTKGAEL